MTSITPFFGYRSPTTNQQSIIDLDQGSAIAESFAREKYPEFWNVSDTRGIEKIVKQMEPSDRSTHYGWFEIYYTPDKNSPPHKNIQGLNSITITVDPFTGKVIGYHEIYTPSVLTGTAPVNLTPAITEEQAQKIAKDRFPDKSVTFNKLMISTSDDRSPHLVWSFGVTMTPPPVQNEEAIFDYTTHFVDVDAHDGTITKVI